MSERSRSQLVGIQELRKNLTKLLDALEAEGQELIITRQGRPAAVLVDLEKYLEVRQALKEFSDPAYLASILEAKEDMRKRGGIPAEEVFRQKGL